MSTATEGECLGETSLLEPGLASATVRVAKESTVWSIDSEDLRAFVAEHTGGSGSLLMGIASCLSQRLRHANELIASNHVPPVETLPEGRERAITIRAAGESAAVEEGLHPQQHQLLLQVAGAPADAVVTIAYAAERLGLRHNSVVELVNRSEAEGLLVRTADPEDQRRVLLKVTRKGKQALERLSANHAREIHELAPRLVKTLEDICALEQARTRGKRRKDEAGV